MKVRIQHWHFDNNTEVTVSGFKTLKAARAYLASMGPGFGFTLWNDTSGYYRDQTRCVDSGVTK
jgi:hypothetical protein